MKVTNFICTGTRERGPLLGKIIIIILSFSVGTSKNKTIDHRVSSDFTSILASNLGLEFFSVSMSIHDQGIIELIVRIYVHVRT